MPTQIIEANPMRDRTAWETSDFLKVSEFFCDSIQGEGITAGVPAAFLRLQGCTLNCSYCDTKYAWHSGGEYSFKELNDLIRKVGLDVKLLNGQHLVITGGSPLLQQTMLIMFLDEFEDEFRFLPQIEIENECTIEPHWRIKDKIAVWNNSPKLSNSGVDKALRYFPGILKSMSALHNSWFKFVVSSTKDWNEILEDFLTPGLIKKGQIILMPQGATRKELEKNRELVVDLAVEHNVRYCSREHIILWGNMKGV